MVQNSHSLSVVLPLARISLLRLLRLHLQRQQQRPHIAQLKDEHCREPVWINTIPPVDRHQRDSQTDASAHSPLPTPI